MTPRALVLLALLACRSPPPGDTVDAAPARPKIVRPRLVVPGETPLDLAQSKLKLVVVKDHVTPVDATLMLRDGAVTLDPPAHARFSVDLDTFDSGIAVRNERVRNIFFETSAIGWESAELAFDLPDDLVARLRSEKKLTKAAVEGRLTVHGTTTVLRATIDAGLDGAKIWVKSAAPAEVKVSDLGLEGNLRRLNAICMHDGIDDVVKVDVSVVFAPKAH